jgi:putative phosphoesterase
MRIGLLSDTHSYLDARVLDHFSACDEIWHAGDIGDEEVIHQLASFKPVRAVYGNIDGQNIRSRFPENLWFEVEGVKILITHIAGAPPRYNPRIKKIIEYYTPGMLICGHSHILRISRDPNYNNMIYVNPGAAGIHGFHKTKTIVRFDVESGTVRNMEVIELGARSKLV